MKRQALNEPISLCLASDDTLDAASIAAIRKAGNDVVTCLGGLEEILDEPLRGKFTQIKTDMNTMLAKLPPSDQAPLAIRANEMLQNLLWQMNSLQYAMSAMSEGMKTAKHDLQTAKNSISGEVDKAINSKVTAGELVKKDDVTNQITTAVNNARTEWQNEQKTLSDRRTALNTAGLPIPADAELAGKDDDFKAKQDKAKTRSEALKPFKVPADKLVTLCWGDQAAYDIALALLNENKGEGKSPVKPNGFQAPSGSTTPAPVNLNRTCC